MADLVWIAILLVCAVCGTAALINAKRFKNQIWSIEKHSIQVYGTVKSCELETKGTDYVRRPVIEYELNGKVKIIDDFTVDKSKKLSEGQIVTVILNSNDESEYLIKETIDSKEYLNVEGGMGGRRGVSYAVTCYLAAAGIIIMLILKNKVF